MRKQKTIIFAVALVLTMSFVLAAQPLPHAFEGQILSDDDSLTSGKTLIAKINGAVTASTKIQGNSYSITVIDNTLTGGKIEFFIGEEKAYESFSFKAFEITDTNLTFDTVPFETIGDCGDGICNANVNECSFCAIDCPVSSCNNNNVCDAAIGEDYVTAPTDCPLPVAPVVTPEPSSGGGGGGGGSSKSTTKNNKDYSKENIVDSLSIDIETLNEEINEIVMKTKEKKGFWNWITGSAISEGGRINSGNGLIVLAVILLVVFLILRRKNKK